MKLQLINLLLFSDKRKNFLLLLAEGPKSINEVLSELQISRISFLPQLKKLKDEGLIIQEGDIYRLSQIGNILVKKLKLLVDTVDVFENNKLFWEYQKLDVIPFEYLKRIGELKGCCQIEPGIMHGFDPFPDIMENFSENTEVIMFYSYFHPQLPSFLLSLAKKGVELKLIFPKIVFERFAADFQRETVQILMQKNSSVFILNTEFLKTPALIAVSDLVLFLGFFNKNCRFDGQYLRSSELSSLQWGKELFYYYMNKAKKISSLDEFNEVFHH